MTTVKVNPQKSQKFLANVSFHTKGKWGVVPKNVSGPSSAHIPLDWYVLQLFVEAASFKRLFVLRDCCLEDLFTRRYLRQPLA